VTEDVSTSQIAALVDMRRHAEAITAAERALASRPDDGRLLCLLAQAYLGAGRAEDAHRVAAAASAQDPDSAWAQRLRSISARASGRTAEAVDAARNAVRLSPYEWRCHLVLGSALLGLPKREGVPEAVRVAYQAAALAPEESDCHALVGAALSSAGDADGAEAAYRRALAIDPQNAAAINDLARISLGRGAHADAAGGFRNALATDPSQRAARRNLEVVLQRVARPFSLSVWIACFVLARVVSSSDGNGTHVSAAARALCVVGFGVCAGILVVRVGGFLRELAPDLRRFYLSMLRRDRRLASGAALHLLSLLLLLAAAATPAGGTYLCLTLAAFAALAGRFAFFRGGRWSLSGLGRRR
jgi:Flp pilus assembly protein TadD